MIEYTISIDGMMCEMCEAHINDTIRKTIHPEKVYSSHKKAISTFVTKDEIDEAYLQRSIEETGYRIIGIQHKPYVKKSILSSLLGCFKK